MKIVVVVARAQPFDEKVLRGEGIFSTVRTIVGPGKIVVSCSLGVHVMMCNCAKRVIFECSTGQVDALASRCRLIETEAVAAVLL